MNNKATILSRRFRGLLPVVIDVETSGLNPATDALLEIAAVTLAMNGEGRLFRDQTFACHVEPFIGARLEKEALEITGIDPFHPLRFAIPERQALYRIFAEIRRQLEKTACYRAVLVGHNAWFDLSFILAAAKRSAVRQNPFHTFTTFDTASLSAVALGETVLARAARRARVPFDIQQAHSAIYDAERTAELFCHIANKWGN
ncbi:Ribonuclease T [Aquicella siphonis]|uniref:Ribonuclease T n=1 Tax=Aquicella siphonis TaxID=254247 RepID=A0A5E4PFI9_9COXI|nr:ribonuclease T [Aquicella siphonis]VVC75258.1 Ribonuclease T [Aquicella siphonis]